MDKRREASNKGKELQKDEKQKFLRGLEHPPKKNTENG